MVYITVFVLLISYIYSLYLKEWFSINLTFLFMFLFCYGVFVSSNLFRLYFFYERSLLPILYIIVKWGSYPERSLRAIMLLIYTSIFTFPFIFVLFYYYYINSSFSLFPIYSSTFVSLKGLACFIVFVTFAVKLPIYGLHFWLPIAHVEAPTFGSMILAGVLLKLGGVGLIRCTPFFKFPLIREYLLSYLIVFILYVTVVCLFQSDFKRLVAYSSVTHIMAVPILLLSNNLISIKSILIVMLFHGLSSPILFILVGVIYSIFSRRQLLLIRGLTLTSPLLRFLMILAFLFTLSAPPFPSFVAEVFFLVSSFCLSSYFIFVFIVFTFFSLLYNLNWLSAIVFSRATTSNISTMLSYSAFMPISLAFVFCVPLSSLTFMM